MRYWFFFFFNLLCNKIIHLMKMGCWYVQVCRAQKCKFQNLTYFKRGWVTTQFRWEVRLWFFSIICIWVGIRQVIWNFELKTSKGSWVTMIRKRNYLFARGRVRGTKIFDLSLVHLMITAYQSLSQTAHKRGHTDRYTDMLLL